MSTDPSEFVEPIDEPSPQEIEAAARALAGKNTNSNKEAARMFQNFSDDYRVEATIALTAAAKVRSA